MDFWPVVAWTGAAISVACMLVSRSTYRKHLQSMSAMTVNPNPSLHVHDDDLSLVVSPHKRPAATNADGWLNIGASGPSGVNGVGAEMAVHPNGPITTLRMAHKDTLIELRALRASGIEEFMKLSAKDVRSAEEDDRLAALASRYDDELQASILSLMGARDVAEAEQQTSVQPVAKSVVDVFATKRVLDI